MAESLATSAAANLVSKLGERLFAPIGRQFGYVLCYKSYVNDLENGVEKLATTRQRVQHSVQEAENNGKPIENDIKKWLESVENQATQAENLLKHGQSAKNACFYGWLPNPRVRHPIGRKVKKMTQVIQRLHDETAKYIFQKVYYENTPIGIVTATTSTTRLVDNKEDVLESRDSTTKVIIKAIADDKVSVIGVYGPGGVGKSKLLKYVEKQVKEDQKLFDVVATTNVSRNLDLKRIQGEIAEALGLHLTNEETTRKRANRLHQSLASDPHRNILIILDNLWEKLDLEEVGIPCGDNNKVRGCKLLLTSRYRDVLIDMCSDQIFQLDVLEHGEARRLFERTVGDRVNDPKFKPWVDGVIKNCGGLPLLIVFWAKRLKDRDLVAWRNASTNRDPLPVQSLVELNYKDLKDERTRSLFLVCALTSGRISIRDSLIYSMGLGLFKDVSKTIKNVRDRLSTDLHSLQDSSLLLDSDKMEWFRMHDIFVDVAISIASTQWNALVGSKGGFKEWSKDELRKCTVISFSYVGIDELPEKLDCPNLRMLLLFENSSSLKIHESFFESTEKLQVLDLTGLCLTTLPSSVKFLENLKSLSLDFCHLEEVAILGKLKGLQFLSFSRSLIARLPKEIGELTELRFLDLRFCKSLKIIEPGVLGRLVNLEELYMEDSFDQWESEDEAPRRNASLAELKNMKKLSNLYIAIPHSTKLSTDLPFGKLSQHKIQIGDVWDWSGEYKESRTLKLKLDSSNLLVEEWMQRCLEITEDLHLDGLQGGNDSIHDLCSEGFQELKHLHVKNSPSFQNVVHSTDIVQRTAFTKLESLFLENLNNLEKICCGCLAPESFSKLRSVKVDKCGELIQLFPFFMMKIFSQLEEIEISRCHSMQQFVRYAEANEIVEDPTMKLCNLRRLTLRNLPEITSFSGIGNNSIVFFDCQQVSLPWLESLTLSELPKLEEIWNSQYHSDVSNLKFLKVEDCTSLSSIIPSNLLIKLQNLEAITVERCELIREVFNLEGLTTGGDVEILSQLTILTLSDLSSLGCLWNENPRRAFGFRNLRTLKVQNCDSLRFLFSSTIAKALEQIKEIEIVGCELMEKIMDVQEEGSEEAATTETLEFPLLTSLSLEELPNLRTFSYEKYCIYCPSLTRLRIYRCPKMTTFSSFKEKQQAMTADTDLQSINSSLSLPIFFNEKVLFPSLEQLELSFMCELKRIWHDQLHGQSFDKLASLTIGHCENLSYVFPSNLIDRLQSLNKIEVVKCPSLEALFEEACLSSEKKKMQLVLFALKKMKLLNLPKLRDILKSDYEVTLAFPSLIEVNVRCCHSLPYLFSNDTAKTLDKLAVLDVSCCNNMRGIIAVEEGKGETMETLKFRQLSTLKLCDLENLISFRSASRASDGLHPLFDEKLAFPKLEALHIEGVQQEELWNDKILVESFCRLRVLKVKQCHNLMNVIPSFMWKMLLYCVESLTVENCPRLRNLFTMSMTKSLRRLQHLGLGGCGEMEYIVAREEEKPEEATDRIVIPQLVILYLHNMPKLRSFCQGNHISEWPSLKKFTVEDCKAVEVILGDASCRKLEGSSIPTEQPFLLVEKVEFPRMESMEILHMDNVEKIWLDELASNGVSKLKMLKVEYCPKLLSIFSSDAILLRFRNLEKLIVTNCGSLEVVFHIQELNISGAQSTSTFQLRELNLEQLPKLKHVWSGHSCGSLTFECLGCLKVVQCQSLKSIFPSPMATSVTRLELLLVSRCGVEEIIAEEDGGVGPSIGDLFFPRLIILMLIELPKLRSFHGNSHPSTWPLLKNLLVKHCGKMRSISFASEIQSCQDSNTNENQHALFSFEKVFPQLEILKLAREDVMMMQHYTFRNLKELLLGCYHDENFTFPSNFLLHRFPNLETLIVHCSSFEVICSEDAFGYEGASLKALRNLKRLRLNNLCNLRRVWKDGSLMVEILRQIEDLFVWMCPNLPIVLPSPTSFQKLMKLAVEDCAGLVHMGTCSAMTSLVHLTQLCIRDCGKMEDVVIDDENRAKKISFPKLEELILDDLSSLESFSPTNCAFMFPSLVRIIVKQCPKMNIFCKGALRTPKLDKVLLSCKDDKGCWEFDLNTTIQNLSI